MAKLICQAMQAPAKVEERIVQAMVKHGALVSGHHLLAVRVALELNWKT